MIIILILLLVVLFIGMYNGLVGKRNQVDNAFAGIDVQLKKRYDLIPNLVATVKGYMQHEQSVLTRLTELRNTPFAQMSQEQKGELDESMRQLMGSLHVTVERYPDLKASDNVMHLQRTLNETEEQLAAARRSFNAAVMVYNTSLQTFPTNLVANMFGFVPRSFFAAEADERNNVNVNL